MAQRKKRKPTPKPKVNIVLPRPKPVQLRGPRYYLQHAREYPFLGCWLQKDWKENGITPVVVARQQDAEHVIFGVFLVDCYCLGVKNAYWNADFPRAKFERELPRMCAMKPQPCEVDFAHELVEQSIAYARRYGFEPHKDYRDASLVLDPPETYPPKYNIEFGKDGKPFYVSGPYDSLARTRQVIDTLMRTAGEGNFDYLAVLGGPSDFV